MPTRKQPSNLQPKSPTWAKDEQKLSEAERLIRNAHALFQAVIHSTEGKSTFKKTMQLEALSDQLISIGEQLSYELTVALGPTDT